MRPGWREAGAENVLPEKVQGVVRRLRGSWPCLLQHTLEASCYESQRMPAPVLKVLIVDDQSHVLDALELLFELRGELSVVRANGPEQALEILSAGGVGVVVHDMNYTEGTTSGEEGEKLFASIRKLDPGLPVVLMTAWGSLRTAVSLVKKGADDYLQKPWDDAALLKKVTQLLVARQHAVEASAAAPTPQAPGLSKANLCGLLFESAAMHSLVSLAVKVATSNVSVLVTGPNGAGKEKIAEIVQANSSRRSGPFIKVNVGALPDELFAAEIFGAEAGAFTGARTRRVGRFEAADGGTLFLDEMGTLSVESQAKLLRALQSGEYERLGSSQTRKSDVRIIAATNVDLSQAIAVGKFREDLFYRLAVIELEVPPLAQRVDDIEPIAKMLLEHHWKAELGERDPAQAPRFSPACLASLTAHAWSGNVRELQNRVQRALLIADGSVVEVEHVGLERASALPSKTLVSPNESQAPAGPSSLLPLEQAERTTIEQALHDTEHVVSKAAGQLGLSRQALYRRMQRLGLKVKKEVG